MEPFGVDKSFYDIGVSDLKELWDSDMDTVSYYIGLFFGKLLENFNICLLLYPRGYFSNT
jgi:hypothetical protein